MSITKSSLSPARKRLLEMMQSINYGRIENLVFINGDPVFKPHPRILHNIRLGRPKEPKIECVSTDYTLKSKTVKMFACFDLLNNGVVEVIEVQNGLPFRFLMSN